jgi:pimeloyl-ACP methyl ester carboxylesterase
MNLKFKKLICLVFMVILANPLMIAIGQVNQQAVPKHSKTIVFVTGAFVHHSVWDNWKTYFEKLGYQVIVPASLYKNSTVEQLRIDPNKPLSDATLGDVIKHYEQIIGGLKEKPILIGHSLGGLIVQHLLSENVAQGGVVIHSLPPKGVITFKYSFLKSVFKPLGYFTKRSDNYMMSLKHWSYSFTNGMSASEQESTYNKFVIPESKRIARGALTKDAKIDYKKPHAPLLILSGSEDHIIPAVLNYKNYKKYKSKQSIVDYKEVPLRNHFVLGQEGWQEEAKYIQNWIETNQSNFF